MLAGQVVTQNRHAGPALSLCGWNHRSVPHLDSGASLQACETALRSLMEHVYAKAYGPDWLTKVAGADKLELWAGRAEEEAKARGRRGALGMPAAGLAYANLYDLIAIAKKHWEPLAPALHPKAEVMPLLE